MRTSAVERAFALDPTPMLVTFALARVVIAAPQRVPMDALAVVVFLAVFVAAIILTRARPAHGLAVLILCDPFAFAHRAGFTTLTTAKVALAGVAIGLIARRTSLAPLRERDGRALLGGAIAIAAATALTIVPGIYIDAVARETLKALEYLAIFVVALLACASDDDERPLWNALATVIAVVCGAAIVQEFTTAPAGLIIAGHVIPRIAGPLEGPNQLAGFLDIALPLLFARVLERRDRIALAVFTFALIADVLTLSRAGAFGAAVGLLAVVLLLANARARRPLALGAGILAAMAAIALARLGVLARLFSTSDVDTAGGLGSRGELWQAALDFWRAHPILGIGAGNFELELPDAGLLGVRTHANSLYLQSLAEGGVVLFGATLWTIVAAVRLLLVRAPRGALFVGVGAATLALAAHQILDFLTFFPKVGGFWWLWLGIATGALARSERTETVET